MCQKLNIYYSSTSGRITNDENDLPLYPSAGDIYVETYAKQIYGQPKQYLSFGYTRTEIKLGVVDDKRHHYLEMNDFSTCMIVRMRIPETIYKDILRRWIAGENVIHDNENGLNYMYVGDIGEL